MDKGNKKILIRKDIMNKYMENSYKFNSWEWININLI